MIESESIKLEHRLCFALYAATGSITRAYRQQLISIGLTFTQYLVLIVLWEQDGQNVKDIASKLHLDSATLTPLLKRLESEGFIDRSRSTKDERIVNIYLTKHGKEIKPMVLEMQKIVASKTGLSDKKFVELQKTLYKVIENLDDNKDAMLQNNMSIV